MICLWAVRPHPKRYKEPLYIFYNLSPVASPSAAVPSSPSPGRARGSVSSPKSRPAADATVTRSVAGASFDSTAGGAFITEVVPPGEGEREARGSFRAKSVFQPPSPAPDQDPKSTKYVAVPITSMALSCGAASAGYALITGDDFGHIKVRYFSVLRYFQPEMPPATKNTITLFACSRPRGLSLAFHP